MLLDIGPRVGQVSAVLGQEMLLQSVRVQQQDLHFAVLRTNIGKCIEDMCQLLRGQILRVVVAAVNCL